MARLTRPVVIGPDPPFSARLTNPSPRHPAQRSSVTAHANRHRDRDATGFRGGGSRASLILGFIVHRTGLPRCFGERPGFYCGDTYIPEVSARPARRKLSIPARGENACSLRFEGPRSTGLRGGSARCASAHVHRTAETLLHPIIRPLQRAAVPPAAPASMRPALATSR